MGLRINLALRDLVQRESGVSYYEFSSEKFARKWCLDGQCTSRSIRLSIAEICAGVNATESGADCCFPLLFFDCGCPWVCLGTTVGTGTLRSMNIMVGFKDDEAWGFFKYEIQVLLWALIEVLNVTFALQSI